MIYNLIRSLFGLSAGRDCRTCGDAIAQADGFGLSEGVCPSCRR